MVSPPGSDVREPLGLYNFEGGRRGVGARGRRGVGEMGRWYA